MLGGDLFQRRLRQYSPLPERGIGHDRNSAAPALGQQLPLDAALAQVVEHLVGGAGGSSRKRQQLVHVARIEIAHAPAPHLAVALQPLEGIDGVGDRDGARPVQEVEIEPVRPEPFERALAGGDRAGSRGVVGIDLADQEYLVATAGDGLGRHLFRTAFAIHLGGVDEGEPEVETGAQSLHLVLPLAGPLAHAPRAETEGRYFLAGCESDGLHGGTVLS